MNAKAKRWEQFERLVAAIHNALDPAATVKWNDTINGRQFDVTIRFKRGLYDYLTVIECKDTASAVPIEKVEAFITKARDAGAHQAVMASSAGFQSGAIEVAKRHQVSLIQLTDLPDIKPLFGASWGPDVPALHVDTVQLIYADGEKRTLPTSAGALTYYMSKIMVDVGANARPLDQVVGEAVQDVAHNPQNVYSERTIHLPSGATLRTPDDEYPTKEIGSIVAHVGMSTARTLIGPVRFDPSLLVHDVDLKNISSGERKTVSRHGLALGTAETFEVGVFYEQPQNENYYYCDAIDADLATIYLVESFQGGGLFQAVITVKTQYASYYSKVSNTDVIGRLRRRLARMKSRKTG